MPPSLRSVTREFALGDATLEDLREAAQAERFDRALARDLLELISEWDNSPWARRDWARNELRASAKKLIPPDPPPSKSTKPDMSMYEAGLRGQKRRG